MHPISTCHPVGVRLPRDDRALACRALLLREDDRTMVQDVLLRGRGLDEVARGSGKTADALRDHLVHVVRRVCSSRFLRVGRAMGYLTADDRRIARLRWCEGYRCDAICAVLGLSVPQARRRIRDVHNRVLGVERVLGDAKVEPTEGT